MKRFSCSIVFLSHLRIIALFAFVINGVRANDIFRPNCSFVFFFSGEFWLIVKRKSFCFNTHLNLVCLWFLFKQDFEFKSFFYIIKMCFSIFFNELYFIVFGFYCWCVVVIINQPNRKICFIIPLF